MSLSMAAQGWSYGQQYVWNVELDADLYTCTANYTLESKYSSPYYLAFYELVDGTPKFLAYANGNYVSKTLDVTLGIGEYIFIVAESPIQVINAPKRRVQAAAGELPTDQLPIPSFDGALVDRYDIYYVTVKYHTETHPVSVPADMISGKGDYQLFTTAGSTDPSNGKTYCGLGYQYAVDPTNNEVVSGAKVINYDASKVNDVVSLAEGSYTYSVYMIDDKGVICWCDRFNITVTSATGSCLSGFVYRKWDDFMFVDNGPNGGRGEIVSYQWYKEGKKIDGATKQWYRTNGTPSTTERYYVLVSDKNGHSEFTCPEYFANMPKSSESNPHGGSSSAPARKKIENGELMIEYNGKWYNAQGIEIK